MPPKRRIGLPVDREILNLVKNENTAHIKDENGDLLSDEELKNLFGFEEMEDISTSLLNIIKEETYLQPALYGLFFSGIFKTGKGLIKGETSKEILDDYVGSMNIGNDVTPLSSIYNYAFWAPIDLLFFINPANKADILNDIDEYKS